MSGAVDSQSRAGVLAALAVGAAVAVAFGLSWSGFPLPWQDEVHIVEMGRSACDGPSTPAAFAIDRTGGNFSPFYFAGPALQEVAYRALGDFGPRLSALVGLLLAGLAAGLWIARRTRSRSQAAFAAALTVANALLLQSVRLVRVDTWAFALIFLALALVWSRPRRRWAGLALAGLLCGVDCFVWPSAFLFAPLVAGESFARERRDGAGARAIIDAFGALAAGTAAGVALGLWASPNAIAATLGQYYAGGGAHGAGSFSPAATAARVAVAGAKEALRDPFLTGWAALGALALARRRAFASLALAALTLALMIPSGLHTYRLVYLWPFLILFAVEAHALVARQWPAAHRPLVFATLAAMVAANALAYVAAAALNPRPPTAEVARRLAAAVGTGPDRAVYSLSLQPYYAARELGWTYRRYADSARIFNPEDRRTILKGVNAVLIPDEPPFYAVEESFTPFGLIRNAAIDAARRGARGQATSRLGAIGAALAFRRDAPDDLRALERDLAAAGFKKTARVSFADWRGRIPGWFRPIAGLALAAEGYDDLDVWTRR